MTSRIGIMKNDGLSFTVSEPHGQAHLKGIWECKGPRIAPKNLKKEEQIGSSHIS